MFIQPVKLAQDSYRNLKFSSNEQTVRTFRCGSYTTLGVTSNC